MLTCKLCGVSKDKSEFYIGNKSTCRKCSRERMRAYQLENPDKVRIWKWRSLSRNRAKQNAYYKEWYAKNGRKRDPIKQKAHSIVLAAVRKGELTRPSICGECGRPERIEAHHNDYTLPLEVLWLCNRCHRNLHPGDPVPNLTVDSATTIE